MSNARGFLLIALFLFLPANSRAAVKVITLEQAYDRTLAADESIQRAYFEIRKARLEPLSALTRLGPTISGNSGQTRNSQNTRSTFDEVTSTQRARNDTGSIGVSYQQTIFDLTALPAYRLGKLTARAATLTYRSTIREVLYGLAQAYYTVLKQQRIVAVARETLHLAQQQLDLARSRAEVGEVTRSDVLRAQVTVEGNRQTLIEAENTSLSNRNTLGNILNLPAETWEITEPAPAAPLAADFAAIYQQAKERREDLRVKAIAIDQDVERRSGIWAQYAPRLVAQLDADRNRVSGSSSSRSHSWDASLTVQVPFFSGGQREIDLAQSGDQLQQTRLDYASFLETVQQEVKDAWLQVRTLESTLDSVRVQVQSAQQAYDDLQTQYKAGTATSVDVLSALNDLNTARRDLATQTYDYQIALRNVEEVTGVFQEERLRKLKFK